MTNGSKCHTKSESHVRKMLQVGEDPRKHISDYSKQSKRDFLQLLRTTHGNHARREEDTYESLLSRTNVE